MLTEATFAAALVSGLRTHGHQPSGADGRRWRATADDSRLLALGLAATGVEPGTSVRVATAGAPGPVARLEQEVAVLAAGGVLVLDGEADRTLAVDDLGELRAAGAELDRRQPSAHEERLAAIDPAAIALRGADLEVTHAQAVWALRSVAAWIGPAVPEGPRCVLADPGPTAAGAMVARWWPAWAGAQLADARAATETARPDVVVGDAALWAELVDVVRGEAERSRAGTALLRRGRVLVAGEVASRAERLGRSVAERRAGERLRAAAGLERLALGICLGPIDIATGRDLAAVGLPVVATWIEPAVPAPVASGPRARPTPADPWGRPLPGRSIDPGPPVVVHGGDLGPEGAPSTQPTDVDARYRVHLAGGVR